MGIRAWLKTEAVRSTLKDLARIHRLVIKKLLIRLGYELLPIEEAPQVVGPTLRVLSATKTGSTSVFNSLNTYKRIERGGTKVEGRGGVALAHVLKREYWHPRDRKKRDDKYITLVRNPVERHVSHLFFFMYRRVATHKGVRFYEPGEPEIWKMPLERIRQKLLAVADYHYGEMAWFDEEVKPHLGLDVYSTPFPSSSLRPPLSTSPLLTGGSKIYRGRDYELLVLKVELPNEEKRARIQEFLGWDRFYLENAYSSNGFPYAGHYRKFKQQIKLPADYLDRMLEHRYARHFYSETEREATRDRWLE